MHPRRAELIAKVRTSGAGAELVTGSEHDVVGEELRAPVKELGECLLPVLRVELVLLLDRDPGKLAPLLGDLLAELRMLGLELRKLITSRLPVRSGRNVVVGHRYLLWR